MPYDDNTEEEDRPNPNGMGQTLNQFRSLYPGGPGGDWADHVSQTINNYVQQRQIGAANAAAGQAFQSNLEQFGQGLLGLVSQDPTAVDTALSLVRPTIATLISNVPGHPEDLAAEHHETISRDLEGSIVEAAVRSAAQRDAGTAKALLAGKTNYLQEGGADRLGAYIDTQANARNLDNAAQQAQQVRAQAEREQHFAVGYLGALVDPDTGQFRASPNWTQRVLNDPNVGPQASAQLISKYGDLLTNGSAQQSNPFLIHDVAQQLASDNPPATADVIAHMGRGLSAADAVAFAAGTMPQTPMAKREYEQLAATLDTAKRTLASPENGAAGNAAFSRFVQWLMPAYRQAGPGSLDPNNEQTILPSGGGHGSALFWNHFAPRLDDLVLNNQGEYGMVGGEATQPPSAPRDSLHEIFGNATPGQDRVIHAPRRASPRTRQFAPGRNPAEGIEPESMPPLAPDRNET